MDFKTYLDKVYGCWLGKCVSGSIGAPLEGCKQLFNYRFEPKFWQIALPNDDLELQILWLNVIEKLGFDFDSEDLAEAFVNNVPYNPGEYAYFKRNYRRGIHPPVSGTFNNHYYHEGMGCCIRAEIWACLAAGDPALAARVCRADGQLDHSDESIYSEMFIAALEAEAFITDDLDRIIAAGLAQIPAASRLAKLVNDVETWCRSEANWHKVREEIIRHWGHPDCTNMFQNIGITLMALRFAGGSLETATLIALNSGFDTDCTCGIAGAIFGIIDGAECLQKKFGVTDTGYITAFELNRRTDRIYDLAWDVARLGPEAGRFWNRSLELTEIPSDVAAFKLPVRVRKLSFEVEYDSIPVIRPGGEAKAWLKISNRSEKAIDDELYLSVPADMSIEPKQLPLRVAAGETATVAINVKHRNPVAINDANLVNCRFAGADYSFGFVAAEPWKLYGPYWENTCTVPEVDLVDDRYGNHIENGCFPNRHTAIRNYHLNATASLELTQIDELALAAGTLGIKPAAVIFADDDLVPVDSSLGYQGPAVFYLAMDFEISRPEKIQIAIGHSCPVAIWLDGKELGRMDRECWWTPENLNLEAVELEAGCHRLLAKMVRHGATVQFSVNFKNGIGCAKERWDAHATDFRFLI